MSLWECARCAPIAIDYKTDAAEKRLYLMATCQTDGWPEMYLQRMNHILLCFLLPSSSPLQLRWDSLALALRSHWCCMEVG
jgi:hypothetical protein